MKHDRKLILENGSEYIGTGFGADRDVVCEIVFNTSMTGYQEILSDPSYTGQGIVMSYPLIGNYGINDEDNESRIVAPKALIIRDLCLSPSNFRATKSLEEWMQENAVAGISGVDTRKLVRQIRNTGTMKGLITDAGTPLESGLEILEKTELPRDNVAVRSCKKKWYARTSNPCFHIVAIDCGIKLNIIRQFNQNKCNVTIVPYDTDASEILSLSPDGVFVSNGPGDPKDVLLVAETLSQLRGKIPLFGICLGHQLLALSCGAQTYKLKFGHRGGNHPVKNLITGKTEITSQNHSYAVDENSLEGTGLHVTHRNLLDGTVEGLRNEEERIISVQYHPESAPGPCDSDYLFTEFIRMMQEFGNLNTNSLERI